MKNFFVAALAAVGLLGVNAAQAMDGFCSEVTLGAKIGLIQEELGFGIEQRCGKSGGLYTNLGLDFWTNGVDNGSALGISLGKNRATFLGINLGAGYDFSEMIGFEDWHPFVGISPMFGLTLSSTKDIPNVSDTSNTSSALGFKIPVGVDYYISESISAGFEYSYNRLWNLGSGSGNDDFSSFFARVNFLM